MKLKRRQIWGRNTLAVCIGLVLFWLVPAELPAQTYKVLHYFTAADGTAKPYGGLILSGTTFYGTTCGPYPRTDSDLGAVFKINVDGTGFTVLKKFKGPDGSAPWRELVLSGDTLYGVTREGGSSGVGTVFRVNIDGGDFRVLRDFAGLDGWEPSGPLVLSGSTLYGMTSGGGAWLDGNLFKINTDGSGFSSLREFRTFSEDGGDPYGGLALSGKTLFGTTVQGGITNAYDPYGCGTVFRIDTDGAGFGVLHRFTGAEAMHPDGGVIVSGDTLYGTTDWLAFAVEPNDGTIFRINADGSNFQILKTFTNWLSDGRGPDYLILSDTTLYGVTWTGGASGNGTVFRINTDGSGFNVLMHFTLSDGAAPSGHLLLVGRTLYGNAVGGGVDNQGVLFALGYAPSLLMSPQTQTAETGSSVRLGVKVADGAGQPVCYQWLFNNTNVCRVGTNSSLLLTNIQPSQAGAYTVVVTNLFGAATSAPAMLQVIVPVERRLVPAIDLMGDAGSLLNLDYANSIARGSHWLPLDTVSLASTSQWYFDVTAPLPRQRCYRAWQTGTPLVLPRLNLPGIVPALTLTGNIGDGLRLDYINQFGPTDAWVNLATVTLTNTPQLYFDTSVIGQPPRLWRIVPVP